MDAGALKHPIVIEQWDEDAEDWVEKPYFSCRAYVNGLSGSEYWTASAVQAENTVDFTVRYCKKLADIIPQLYRIKFRGVPYDITTIDNIRFEDKWLKIRAVRKSV